jgi:hypothetical protein
MAATAVPTRIRTHLAVNANGPACAKEAGHFDAQRVQARSTLPESSGLWMKALSQQSVPCLGFPFAPEWPGRFDVLPFAGLPAREQQTSVLEILYRNAAGKNELRTPDALPAAEFDAPAADSALEAQKSNARVTALI